MIDTIVFDLGGVLYDIAPERTFTALKDLSVQLDKDEFTTSSPNSAVNRYECGLLSTDDFIGELQKKAANHVGADALKLACCELLVGFTRSRIDYLQALKKRYRLYLLSNTNAMHIEQINEELCRDFNIQGLSGLFEKPFLSYKMGVRKPSSEIYMAMISEVGLNPEATLFVDDLETNVLAAKKCGLQVLHKPRHLELYDCLQPLLS